jgi:hypothetical protein
LKSVRDIWFILVTIIFTGAYKKYPREHTKQPAINIDNNYIHVGWILNKSVLWLNYGISIEHRIRVILHLHVFHWLQYLLQTYILCRDVNSSVFLTGIICFSFQDLTFVNASLTIFVYRSYDLEMHVLFKHWILKFNMNYQFIVIIYQPKYIAISVSRVFRIQNYVY